jgi:transcriptional regulator with PAS, ATPase and Fis domain
MAEAMHRQSPRAGQRFIEVNCAALTAASLDSELFGVEQGGSADGNGAFRPGLLEAAQGGTIFLDEIGDLDAHLQPKLLRVLEGKTFRRQGGTREVQVDVRLIAATSHDLATEVNAGRFREDLYYRLSVMPISLPPVRARAREDVVELIGHLLDDLHGNLPEGPTEVDDDALARLLRYSWPGNVREMRNVLERAMIIGRGAPSISAAHLASEVRDASGTGAEHHVPRTLVEIERQQIERALRANEGNRTRACRELGISRATLIKKIRTYGIDASSAVVPWR